MRRRAWTTYEVKRLRELYPRKINHEIAAELKRTESAIHSMARSLNLRKLHSPQRISAWQSENERLRDRVAELEALLGVTSIPPTNTLGLGRVEIKLLGVLMHREFASRGMIYNALYGDDSDRQEKTIDVHISKIRRKLAPHGHEIKTSWGEGYYLEPATRAALKDICGVPT